MIPIAYYDMTSNKPQAPMTQKPTSPPTHGIANEGHDVQWMIERQENTYSELVW